MLKGFSYYNKLLSNMQIKEFYMYPTVHSDFIIHWTGKDIDKNPTWSDSNSSETDDDLTAHYIDRLKNILKFGLWMTPDSHADDKLVKFNKEPIEKPLVSRTCFTELRLSDVREHAKKFGRLGIGFKRYFLFERMGGPINYFYPTKDNWMFHSSHLKNNKFDDDAYYTCFLKPMFRATDKGSNPNENTYNYDFYNESEWRIIYSEEISKKFPTLNCFFQKPSDWPDEFTDFLAKKKIKGPDYLIPLSAQKKKGQSLWFAMIIYPSLQVKVEAERDPEIRELIKNLKPDFASSVNQSEKGPVKYEYYCKPIEVALDACRNF